MKTIMKEIIIILLLIVAILLIFAVLFYDSIPMNKVVPSEVARTYEIPSDLKNEINSVLEDENTTVVINDVNEQIINKAQKDKDLIQGKEDPFAEVSSQTSEVVDGGSNKSNSGSSDSSTKTTPTTTPKMNDSSLSKGGAQPDEPTYKVLQK